MNYRDDVEVLDFAGHSRNNRSLNRRIRCNEENNVSLRTRPEAIKMAPLVKEFQKHPESFETIVRYRTASGDVGSSVKNCSRSRRIMI